MRPTRRRLAWVAACVALGSSAGPAAAAFITYDLSGNWTGTITCSELVGGVKQKTVTTSTMKITQAGVNFGVQIGTGLDTRLYAGLANADAKKPEKKGEATLALCGTDNVLGVSTDELVHVTVSNADKIKASLKGLSYFSAPTAPGPHLGTCKWKWKRIDRDPGTLATDCAGFTSVVASSQRTGGAQ